MENKAATSTIPIVFETGGDPVQYGLVASLDRPGSNITGAVSLNVELGPKRHLPCRVGSEHGREGPKRRHRPAESPFIGEGDTCRRDGGTATLILIVETNFGDNRFPGPLLDPDEITQLLR